MGSSPGKKKKGMDRASEQQDERFFHEYWIFQESTQLNDFPFDLNYTLVGPAEETFEISGPYATPAGSTDLAVSRSAQIQDLKELGDMVW